MLGVAMWSSGGQVVDRGNSLPSLDGCPVSMLWVARLGGLRLRKESVETSEWKDGGWWWSEVWVAGRLMEEKQHRTRKSDDVLSYASGKDRPMRSYCEYSLSPPSSPLPSP